MSAYIPRSESAASGSTLQAGAVAGASATAPTTAGSGVCRTLSELERGVTAIVTSVRSPASPQEADLVRRLIEVGFVAGEKLRVIARGQPGNEPIAVRIGGTAFALRRVEAEHVHVAIAGEGAW